MYNVYLCAFVYGMCVWCSYVACVCTWCVRMCVGACIYDVCGMLVRGGVCMWYVYVCGVCSWCMCDVVVFSVCVMCTVSV